MSDTSLKKAERLIDCFSSFELEPLRGAAYDAMFCNTNEARMGDKNGDPISDLIDNYMTAKGPKHTLVIGHRGCGKSTEMERFNRHMKNESYLVANFSVRDKLDLLTATYIDLLVMLMVELVNICDKSEKIELSNSVAEDIYYYWKRVTEKEIMKGTSLEGKLEAGVKGEADTPATGFFRAIASFFGNFGGAFKVERITRTHIKTIIEPEIVEFIALIRRIAIDIGNGLRKQGRPELPIIVLDDLDKLEPPRAKELFFDHGSTLALLPFHVIYTFPIQLTYAPEFNSMLGYFEYVLLPMIKLRSWDNHQYERFDEGWAVIDKIVRKRADEALFEKEALNYMIEKTGGYLRDLFRVIINAVRRANRRGVSSVEMEDAKAATVELKSEIGRMITGNDIEILKMIYNGKKQIIQKREALLDLLQSRAVLEYNGARWCDLHPLLEELLLDNKIIGKKPAVNENE